MTTTINGTSGLVFPDASAQVSAGYSIAEINQLLNTPAFIGGFSGSLGGAYSLAVVTNMVARYDPTGAWNPTTDKFQPNVAGIYQINFSIVGNCTAALTYIGATIKKNAGGVGNVANNYTPPYSASLYAQASISCLMYLDGVTDFIQFLVDANGAAGALTWTSFEASAALVRRM